MRFVCLAACFMLALPISAFAQSLPSQAMRNAAPIDPVDDFYIPGTSVTPLLLAEWDVDNGRGGKTVEIDWGKEAVDKAPANASRYEQKSFIFPTGTIRVMEFKKAKGGMIHMISVETALFVLKGSGTVEVAGKTVEINEGDVVSYPSGVLRGTGDATIIAWTTTGTVNNEAAKATVVRAADAPSTDSAEWDEGGKRVRANTPEALAKAPADAIRLNVKRYNFDGNSVRVARNKKGGPTSPTSGTQDNLIYVASGHLRFFHDDKAVEAVPGDALREVAGSTHHWYRIEDSMFIATSSMPVVPMPPAKAK